MSLVGYKLSTLWNLCPTLTDIWTPNVRVTTAYHDICDDLHRGGESSQMQRDRGSHSSHSKRALKRSMIWLDWYWIKINMYLCSYSDLSCLRMQDLFQLLPRSFAWEVSAGGSVDEDHVSWRKSDLIILCCEVRRVCFWNVQCIGVCGRGMNHVVEVA